MPEITLVLTQQEQQAFEQLLDVALRQAGSGALACVSHFTQKLAVARAAAPPVPPVPPVPPLPSGVPGKD